MARSPVSVANLCFFELDNLDWCACNWEDPEDDDELIQSAAQVEDQELIQPAAQGSSTGFSQWGKEEAATSPTGREVGIGSTVVHSLKRRGSLEGLAVRFQNTQQELFGGSEPALEEKNKKVAEPAQSVARGNNTKKPNSLRSALIRTMLSSGDNVSAQADSNAAHSGYPLIANPYQVLQVRRDATTSEIQHAYRRLALWHHPGRCCGGTVSLEERTRHLQVFEILAASYETLLDRETRTRCDVLLREKYDARARSKKIPVGQVCVGGKPLDDNHHSKGRARGTTSSIMEDHSTMENFVTQMIGQLAAIRSFGSLGDNDAPNNETTEVESEKNTTQGRRYLLATPPNLDPISSSDSSLEAPEHCADDNRSDCSSECSLQANGVSAAGGRIHIPLGKHRRVGNEECESSPVAVTVVFGSGTRSSTPSPVLQRTLEPEESNVQEEDLSFLSNMNACGVTTVGSVDSQDSHEQPLPALINSSSTLAEAKGEIHYTEGETNRLFGGPLQLLYRARRWRPFKDPFDVFAEVFGSRVALGLHTAGSGVPATPEALTKALGGGSSGWGNNNAVFVPSRSSGTRAGWTGSSETLPDGTVLLKTSRVLHNRRMTRTEVIRTDPSTGLKYSRVTVASEAVSDNEDEAEDDQDANKQAGCNADNFFWTDDWTCYDYTCDGT